MKHETSVVNQPGQADFKFRKLSGTSGSGGGDGGDPSDKPPKYERYAEDLVEADRLVNLWLHDERFLPSSQEMQEQFPLTFIHEIQVARGATVLALRLGVPEIVRTYTSQGGIMHDSGKLAYPNVRWDETIWTEKEKIDNKTAVRKHSLKSAEKTKSISPVLADIVALHHIFQKPDPYPVPQHPSYRRLLLPQNRDAFTAARLLGLFDHFEASETRSGDGTDAFTDALVARMKKHTFVSLEGKDTPAYTDDEIRFARETYELITLAEKDKAA